MAVRLITEVLRYVRAHPEVSTTERLVLMLIAERAQEQTREAWQGGADDWDLGELAGLTDSGLRRVFQRLATRGIDVRVAHGNAEDGRPVYAAWKRQTTYRLPKLGGTHVPPTVGPVGDTDVPPTSAPVGGTHVPPTPPIGGTQVPPTASRRRHSRTAQAVPTSRVGGTPVTLGGTPVPPFSSLPSGPSRSVTGNGREPRTAPPRGPLPEEQTPPDTIPATPTDDATNDPRARARAIAAKAQKRPPTISHWTTGTAPQGEANGAYDPAGTAERLAGEPTWEPDPAPDQTEEADTPDLERAEP